MMSLSIGFKVGSEVFLVDIGAIFKVFKKSWDGALPNVIEGLLKFLAVATVLRLLS